MAKKGNVLARKYTETDNRKESTVVRVTVGRIALRAAKTATKVLQWSRHEFVRRRSPAARRGRKAAGRKGAAAVAADS